eukprot:TRINITY_DN26710_c0_g2_i1.p1 TRINITY_DN26710_c0_g2~~TRINITY_DN26710_c0_g2_i1.p1  ORF type:complete len:188 (-),score=9.48 TRINITY_DN26710_c0_g2_i1:103-666(-)
MREMPLENCCVLIVSLLASAQGHRLQHRYAGGDSLASRVVVDRASHAAIQMRTDAESSARDAVMNMSWSSYPVRNLSVACVAKIKSSSQCDAIERRAASAHLPLDIRFFHCDNAWIFAMDDSRTFSTPPECEESAIDDTGQPYERACCKSRVDQDDAECCAVTWQGYFILFFSAFVFHLVLWACLCW